MFANLLKYIWLKIYSQVPAHTLQFFQILFCNAKEIFFKFCKYISHFALYLKNSNACNGYNAVLSPEVKQSIANLNALSCVTVGQRWQKQQNSKTIIIMIESFS